MARFGRRISPAPRALRKPNLGSSPAAARWVRHRFGDASFERLGLSGGELVDAGLADLAFGRTTKESLAVSLAAPRLRREGVPVGPVLENPEARLYEMLAETEGDLAHARYNAYL